MCLLANHPAAFTHHVSRTHIRSVPAKPLERSRSVLMLHGPICVCLSVCLIAYDYDEPIKIGVELNDYLCRRSHMRPYMHTNKNTERLQQSVCLDVHKYLETYR